MTLIHDIDRVVQRMLQSQPRPADAVPDPDVAQPVPEASRTEPSMELEPAATTSAPPPTPAHPAVPQLQPEPHLAAVTELVEALGLSFHLGTAVERIGDGSRRGKDGVAALREAAWLIERHASLVEQYPDGVASPHVARPRAKAPVVPEAPAPEPDRGPPVEQSERAAPDESHDPFGRELALMAARWAIMVVSVIVVVLAVTLIGAWL